MKKFLIESFKSKNLPAKFVEIRNALLEGRTIYDLIDNEHEGTLSTTLADFVGGQFVETEDGRLISLSEAIGKELDSQFFQFLNLMSRLENLFTELVKEGGREPNQNEKMEILSLIEIFSDVWGNILKA